MDKPEFSGLQLYTEWMSERIEQGENVTVKYCPDDPTEFYLEEHFPNKALNNLTGSIVFFTLGGVTLFFSIRKRRRL